MLMRYVGSKAGSPSGRLEWHLPPQIARSISALPVERRQAFTERLEQSLTMYVSVLCGNVLMGDRGVDLQNALDAKVAEAAQAIETGRGLDDL
jgi:hypothetical protein